MKNASHVSNKSVHKIVWKIDCEKQSETHFLITG